MWDQSIYETFFRVKWFFLFYYLSSLLSVLTMNWIVEKLEREVKNFLQGKRKKFMDSSSVEISRLEKLLFHHQGNIINSQKRIQMQLIELPKVKKILKVIGFDPLPVLPKVPPPIILISPLYYPSQILYYPL